MSLGVNGRESSWDNLFSCTGAFGISETRAVVLAKKHLTVLENWAVFYQDAGVSDNDITLLRSVIEPRMSATIEQVTAKNQDHQPRNLNDLVLDDIVREESVERGRGRQRNR